MRPCERGISQGAICMFTVLDAICAGVFFFAATYNWRLAKASREGDREELYHYVVNSFAGGILLSFAVMLDLLSIPITNLQALLATFIGLGGASIWIWLYEPETELSAAALRATGTPQRRNRLRVVWPCAALFVGISLLCGLLPKSTIATSSGLRPIAPLAIVAAPAGVLAALFAIAGAWKRRGMSRDNAFPMSNTHDFDPHGNSPRGEYKR